MAANYSGHELRIFLFTCESNLPLFLPPELSSAVCVDKGTAETCSLMFEGTTLSGFVFGNNLLSTSSDANCAHTQRTCKLM